MWMVVHFSGWNIIFYQAMPHGNSKHDSEFVRTMQSVVEEIKCKEGDPHKVYKKMSAKV
jgi:hypothetical protein